MNFGVYTNGFTPGETVTIDMPRASFDGMETSVLRPRPMDILGPEEVLVRNPVDHAWVLKMHKDFLLKTGERGFRESSGAAQACAVPASPGVVIW